MTHDEIEEMLRNDLATVLKIDPAGISRDTALADLEVDSIDLVEVIGIAEGKLSIALPDQGFHDIQRFDQLVAMVEDEHRRTS